MVCMREGASEGHSARLRRHPEAPGELVQQNRFKAGLPNRPRFPTPRAAHLTPDNQCRQGVSITNQQSASHGTPRSPEDQCGDVPRDSEPTTDSSISGSPLTANRRFRSSVTVWNDCRERGAGRQGRR